MNNTGNVEIERLIAAVIAAKDELGKPEYAEFGLPPEQKALKKLADRLRDQARHSSRRYTVLLLGEFNAGKSTFLNALFGLKGNDKLRVGPDPKTAKPTRLTFRSSGDPAAKLIFLDDREEVMASLAEALIETTEETVRSRQIREVVLFLDDPLLHAIDFLDMPGTGAAYHSDHTDITREYVANAELILWMNGNGVPTREGKGDIRLAGEQRIPVATVFNAWGFLDKKKDEDLRESGFDQEQIEEELRTHFPAAFKHHPRGFRVYAGKCVESLERGAAPDALPEEFGLTAFKNWLGEEYLQTLPDMADARARNVREQVARIRVDAAADLKEWAKEWEGSLERDGEKGAAIRRENSAVERMAHVLNSKIRGLASERADIILKKLQNAAEEFIEAKLQVDNFDMLKKLATHGPAKAAEILAEEMRRDYLHLDQSPSWLDAEAQDFIKDAWVVTEAEWRRFLEDIPLESPVAAAAARVPDLPFGEIEAAVKQGITSVIQRLAAAGAVIGILLVIPGGQVIDAVFIGGLLVTTVFFDPLAKPRQNAIRRMRSELDLQRTGLKNQLQDEAMKGGHASLKKAFQKDLDARRGEVDKRRNALSSGGQTLGGLQKILCDEYSNS